MNHLETNNQSQGKDQPCRANFWFLPLVACLAFVGGAAFPFIFHLAEAMIEGLERLFAINVPFERMLVQGQLIMIGSVGVIGGLAAVMLVTLVATIIKMTARTQTDER